MSRAASRRSLVPAALVVTSAALVGGGALATPPAMQVTHGNITGSMPKGVTLSPDGTRLYVSNFGNSNANNIGVYDAADLHLIESINVPGIVVETAIAPDGHTLYVSNFTRDSVQFIDLQRRRVTREVHVGSHPKILALSHDGTRLFAANWGGRSVTEVEAATGRVVRTLPAGQNPRGMVMTRAGRLYVANFNGHTIDVYDGAAMEHHHRIEPVCHIPRHLVLSPDERTLYISCFSANEVAAMDTASETIVHRVEVGHWPKAIDVTRDGRYVFSANYGGSSVSVVDTSDWTSTTLDVPSMDHASGVVAAHDGPGFYVTGWYDSHVFSVGLAGAGPTYTVSDAIRTLTLRRREYHRVHPAE